MSSSRIPAVIIQLIISTLQQFLHLLSARRLSSRLPEKIPRCGFPSKAPTAATWKPGRLKSDHFFSHWLAAACCFHVCHARLDPTTAKVHFRRAALDSSAACKCSELYPISYINATELPVVLAEHKAQLRLSLISNRHPQNVQQLGIYTKRRQRLARRSIKVKCCFFLSNPFGLNQISGNGGKLQRRN